MRGNPVREVRRPKKPPARDRRLHPGEEARLLVACGTARGGFLLDCVQLAIETGMRQGEIVGLDWKDVDLERQIARLHAGATKNGHGRGVPLSRTAVAVLQRRGPAVGSVFQGVTTEAVKQAFAKAAARAGMAELHFHDLRHEAISRLFERGFNVMEAAAVSGHRDLAVLRRYVHLEASALASRLGQEPGPGVTSQPCGSLAGSGHPSATQPAETLPNVIELAAVTEHRSIQMLKRYSHPTAEALSAKLR